MPRPRRRIVLAVATGACLAATGPALAAPTHAARAVATAPSAPTVQVSTVVRGLSYPWDLSFTPDGTMLFDERPGRLWARTPDGTARRLAADESDLFVGSEAGLEGLLVDRAFATNRQFYTCQAYRGTGTDPVDLRVIRWKVDAGYTTATRVGAPVLTGLPITSGRHAGCRLRFAADGTLRVSAGDAADETNPQNLQSLGGKTLRVRVDGTIPTDNPFYAKGGNARYVYTYGHRNPQGLALRPWNSQMWSVEHGPDRDDEVNLLQAGGNYGWDPGPDYDENVPMTDLTKFPTAIVAKWSSGYPTVAPSGGAFLVGSGWGRWQGALAVGILADEGVMVLTVDPAGTVTKVERIPALQHGYGRIRAAQLSPGGALYVTTSNGSDDKILRIAPTPTYPAYRPGLDISPAGVAAALRPDGVLGVFVRSTGGHACALLHTASGSTPWQCLTDASRISAPALVATGGDRFDAFAIGSARDLLHWTYTSGRWSAVQHLGGVLTSAPAAVTLGDGSIDVFARGTDNALWRRRWDGSVWRPWSRLGGVLTSAPGASADAARRQISLVVRGTNGYAYRMTVSPTAIVSGFSRTTTTLWSARSFTAAASAGAAPYGLDTSYDGAPVLTHGSDVDTLNGRFGGAPAIAALPGKALVAVGRSPGLGIVYYCNLIGGHCTFASLGGRTS